MYCITCGHFVLDGYKFCSHCGTSTSSVTQTQTQPEIQQETQPEVSSYEYYPYEEIPLPEAPPVYEEQAEEIAENTPAVKEKYFFGKPALMFCLTIIALLSVTSGLFMGLYLNAA